MKNLALGTAIAIGVGIGTALFAGSGNPAWIGFGAGFGVAAWSLHRLFKERAARIEGEE